MVEFIDTHCHLDMARDVDAVLARARSAGVVSCLTVGTSLESSRANVALAKRHPNLRASVGIHPHDADQATDEIIAAVDALAEDPHVVAIGEVGLDFFRQHASAEGQRRTLRAFLDIAARRHLPLLLHCRDAYEELLDRLTQAGGPYHGLIHCASGPPAFIEEAIRLGFFVSFSGTVTFPNAAAVRALVPLVPDERLLIETDAPFLAPQPVRGQTNEPAYVAHTAAALAALRGTTVEALARLTTNNARILFKFGARHHC